MTIQFPQSWLQDLDDVVSAQISQGVFPEGLIRFKFRLSSGGSGWVEAMAEEYRTTEDDVVITCLKVGKYIHENYPRAHKPEFPFVQAVLNGDRLQARAGAVRSRIQMSLDLGKAFLANADFSGRFGPAREDRILPRFANQEDEPFAPAVPVLPLPKSTRPATQLMDSSLLEWIFRASLARECSPEDTVEHSVQTCRFFDMNVPDHQRATLAEEILVKILYIDKLGQEISKVLSSLETFVTDWPATFECYAQKFDLELR